MSRILDHCQAGTGDLLLHDLSVQHGRCGITIAIHQQHFGADVSASVMGSQMAFAYGGFMAAPPLFGLLAEYCGAQLFPVYTLVWFVLLVVFSVIFRRTLKKQ